MTSYFWTAPLVLGPVSVRFFFPSLLLLGYCV